MEAYNKIYPPVPQAPQSGGTDSGTDFRLQKSQKVLERLENEVKHYENVGKKYKRTRSIVSKISMGTGFLSIGLGSSGVGTSLTGVGVVVGVPLGTLAGVFGLMSVSCAAFANRLSKKVSKHDQTVALAKSEANCMRDIVSKALEDGKMSDEKFSFVLKEEGRFEAHKKSIRRKEEKNSVDMNKIREEVRVEMLKNLTTVPSR